MSGYPGTAYRPHLVEQLHRDPDAGWGNTFAGSNCGVSVDAMGLERSTLGRLRYSGAELREILGDKVGGTNLSQSDALYARFGVELEVRTPARFVNVEQALYVGRGINLAGYYAPVQGTEFQGSETFTQNHRIWVNEGRGWSKGKDGLWHADEYLWFDPLADGRRNGIDQGPTWVPRSLVRSFAWRLNIADPAERYVPLGEGLAYVGITKDTEPHVILRYGGVRTNPFPDRTRGVAPAGHRVAIRREPNRNDPPVDTLGRGELFTTFQRTASGQAIDGSRVWFGNQNGTRWVHSANLSHKGGST